MTKLTMADCKNVKISNLYLGLAMFETGPEDAEAIEAQKNSPEEIEKVNELFDKMHQIVEEKVPSDFKDDFMYLINDMIDLAKALPTMRAQPMFLLYMDGCYYSLNDGELDLENAIKIDRLEPLSDYYSEEEYRFVEVNGKVCLDVDSPEPFERYTKKVLSEFALI